MDEGQQLQIILAAKIDKFERDMQRAAKITNDRFRSMEGRAKTSSVAIESSMANATTRINDRLKGIGAGFLAGFSIVKAQQFIDKATRITNALKVAGLSGDDLTKVYDRLFVSAQKNGAPMESLVQLYSRAALQQKELGVSSEDLLRFTDNVALALRVAGTDAQSASGALLQLGQALGSGTVHAEEFNSIMEGAPTIAQAAAAGIREAGGSVAKLKQLVIDGKLSSRAFFDGFSAGAEMLATRAAGAEMTISSRFVRLENVLTDVAGKFDANSHATELFGRFLDELGVAIREFTDNMSSAAPAIGEVERFLNMVNAAAENLGKNIGSMTGLDQVGPAITKALNGVDVDPVQKKLGELQKTVTALQEAIKFNTEMGIDTSVVQGQLDQVLAKMAAIRAGAVAVVTPLPDQSDKSVAAAINGAVPFNPLAPINSKPAATKPKTITLADYPVTGGSGGGGKGRKGGSRGDGFERELQDTQRRIELLRLETAAQAGVNPLIDDYGAAVEKARLKQELLNAAQDAGHKITPELEKTIEALAGSYANASTDAQRLADKQDLARENAEKWANLEKSTVGGFLQDLKNGTSPIDALNNALSRLADTMIDQLLDAIFQVKNAGAGSGGGFFGFLGNLFGFGGGASAFTFAPGMGLWADGGYTGHGGKYEPAGVVHRGEYVLTKDATRRIGVPALDALNYGQLPGFAAGGYVGERAAAAVSRTAHGSNDNAAPAININAPITVNGSAGTPAQNDDLAKKTAKAMEATMRGIVADEMRRQKRVGNMYNNQGF